MRGKGRSRADTKWLKDLGRHIEKLILSKYSSTYQFCVEKAGSDISRATLNFIIAGKSDPKATSLKIIAKHLNVPVKKLLDF